MSMRKLTIAALAVIFAIAVMAQVMGVNPSMKLRMAEDAIARLYVDTVNEDKLVEEAIRGMLESLDPHSAYSTAEETRQLNEPLEGNFSGIGIQFNMMEDTLYVIQTIAGGPSERAGVMAGDRMISVNDTVIAGVSMKNNDIMKRLRGPKGTEVNVKMLRRNSGAPTDTIDFLLVRDDIPIHSVDAAYMVAPGVGYLRLNKFAANTHEESMEALKKLRQEGMKDLILDLTDNGGGYLQAAVDLLGELLPKGSLAVYTEGLNSPRYDMTAKPSGSKPLLEKGKLVVMVNQNSASASEIVSGAVQDWDRGTIVGRRTFGKGLVQRPLPFPDGSMMRLTVAHYYTPSGRDIQKPYKRGDRKSYLNDLTDRFNRGELMHADSVQYADSLKVKSLRKGRTLYGGGGISPDVFVPLDTTEYTKYYRNLLAKGVINKYAIGYVDANRKEIAARYTDGDDFVERFEVTDDMLIELKSRGETEKVEFVEEDFERSKPLLKMIIKGIIGRDVFDDSVYFKVWNRHDPIFREAVRVITE